MNPVQVVQDFAKAAWPEREQLLLRHHYRDILRRQPSAKEFSDALAEWPTQVQQLEGFLTSVEYMGKFPTGTEYAYAVYHGLLGRDPLPNEIPADVHAILNGIEFREDYAGIWYSSFLGRQASIGEAQWWARKGGTLENITSGIFGSEEYVRQFKGDLPALLLALYNDFLGRTPDPDGAAFWAGKLGCPVPTWAGTVNQNVALTQSEPSVACPPGAYLVSFNDTTRDGFGGLMRSTDGTNWLVPTIHDDPRAFGDRQLTYVEALQTVYMVEIGSAPAPSLNLYWSQDSGISWQGPLDVLKGQPLGPGAADKPSKVEYDPIGCLLLVSFTLFPSYAIDDAPQPFSMSRSGPQMANLLRVHSDRLLPRPGRSKDQSLSQGIYVVGIPVNSAGEPTLTGADTWNCSLAGLAQGSEVLVWNGQVRVYWAQGGLQASAVRGTNGYFTQEPPFSPRLGEQPWSGKFDFPWRSNSFPNLVVAGGVPWDVYLYPDEQEQPAVYLQRADFPTRVEAAGQGVKISSGRAWQPCAAAQAMSWGSDVIMIGYYLVSVNNDFLKRVYRQVLVNPDLSLTIGDEVPLYDVQAPVIGRDTRAAPTYLSDFDGVCAAPGDKWLMAGLITSVSRTQDVRADLIP